MALGPRGSPVEGHVWSGFTKCENCREVSLRFSVQDPDVTGQLEMFLMMMFLIIKM